MPIMAQHWGSWRVVPGAGHWVQYEAADLFMAALKDVLNADYTA
jgi:pimeloyl-ACP methyl ester carboxylesterase